MSNVKTSIFNIARPVDKVRNKYEWFASKYKLNNYRVITSGELNIRGKSLEIPSYLRTFIRDNGEVLLLANRVRGEVSSIVFRGIKDKTFMNYGFGKGNLYGIGDLDDNFTYGDLLIVVEGTIDRDLSSKLISKNCVSILTSSITLNQSIVLKYLTNKVLLLLDNDEAGLKGTNTSKRKLNSLGITVYTIKKSNKIKDLGDIAQMLMDGRELEAESILSMYRAQIQLLGGKLV